MRSLRSPGKAQQFRSARPRLSHAPICAFRYVIRMALLASAATALANAPAPAQAAPPQPGGSEVQVGDRILVMLAIAGDTARTDTITVREGRSILLPVLPDLEISLQGVRRAELSEFLTRELAKYVREPRVQAKVLLRLQLSGGVSRPGFYQVESDLLLSDVIMLAGGPAGSADLQRTVVKRRGQRIIAADQIREHLVVGTTLDQLDLQPGDEIEVGMQRPRNLTAILQATAAIAGTAFTIVYLANRF